ncbi:hypothetical protein CON42_08435 [Bacillus thuringiensis]|uniref:DinB family protein n=1 Tax=Bacillus thuringiensis TaxID=1428 RepID=UPI000BEC9036|nr:DinB family protein [Bacillus thuringiensis]MED3053031.1 DinB family protein [Bacillus thuringiensis]PEA16729.1 hypothetical protein CON42_08435 [Bacillus thuringiensis]PFH77366.1 hypothetical protein COI56_06260 [Bacillus thuringiensis]
MEPTVGMLFAMVESNYERLKSIVQGMSQEELDYQGYKQKYNSTAQLIRHLTYVDLQWVYRIKDQPIPEFLEKKYGPMLDENNKLPFINGIPLKSLFTDYDDVFNMFKSTCYRLTNSELNKIVSYENEKNATIQWGIWHMADHNRFHQAHISQLRKWYNE